VLGARAVIVHGISGVKVAAATAIDATLEFGAQIAYALLGLVLLMLQSPDSLVTSILLASGCVATAAAVGALLTLVARGHGADLSARLAARFAGGWSGGAFGRAAAVQAEITRLLQWSRVWPSYLLHFAAWVAGAVEAWLALRLMGVSPSFPAILTIESLVYATRAMAFMVPNAIGVQEGAYILLGGALGLTPEFALSLSLLKRGRDLALGIPALVLWQLSESRRHWLASRTPAVATVASDSRGEQNAEPTSRFLR
jgi:putative membrane protein